MNRIFTVLRFGAPYLRRYQARLAAGILMGILFGLSNAGFVWATKTLIGRLAPEAEVRAELKPQRPRQERFLDRLKVQLDTTTHNVMDPWLPYIGRPITWKQVLGGVLFLPVLVAIRGVVGYLSSYCMGWVGEKVVNDLRNDVLVKLNSLSLDYFNRATMGDMITHVTGDTAMLQRCLRVACSDLIKEPMTFIGVLSALFIIDWRLTSAVMVFFPLCVVPVFLLGKKARKAARRGTEASVTQSSLLVEILAGIRVVKAFGLEAMQVQRFCKYSQQMVRQNLKGVRARELINPIIETVSMIGFGLLIVYIVYRNHPVADMIGFLTGLIFFYTPVKKLSAIHVMFEQTAVGVSRLMRILS